MRPIPFYLESPDIAEYASHLEGPWELEYEQLEGGEAIHSIKGLSVGSDSVYVEKSSRTVGVRGCVEPGTILISSPGQESRRGRFWGSSLETDHLVVVTHRWEADVTMPPCDNVEVTVNEAEFRSFYRQWAGTDPDFLDQGSPFLPMTRSGRERIESLWRRLVDGDAAVRPGFSLGAEVARLIARGLVPDERSTWLNSRQTRRVRDCLADWEAAEYDWNVSQLCRNAGVSERTLGIWFRNQVGMSPHRFLLRRRLNLVHRDLLRSDPATVTVTDVAMRFGFHELGRFAGVYREFFGELPSATLRKRSGATARQVKVAFPA